MSSAHGAVASARKLSYFPQLDALRAFAVFAVLFHHFMPDLSQRTGDIDWGGLAVLLFFVISGFLITSILLRYREAVDAGSTTRVSALRNFYIRRSLRIWPIYYLIVLICLVVGLPPVWQIIPWLLSYSLNVQVAIQGAWPGPFSHLWSLAVEEQFYLLWPLIVLFGPKRKLPLIALAMIVIAPIYRFSMTVFNPTFDSLLVLSPAHFDGLGMGCLLSILQEKGSHWVVLRRYLGRAILPAAIIAVPLGVVEFNAPQSLLAVTTFDLVMGLVFSWLVFGTVQGFRGVGGTVFNSRVLRYIGKISYGVYIYHLFMPVFVPILTNLVGWTYQPYGVISFFVWTAAALLIAAASWHFVEKPINDLKQRFPFEAPTDAVAASGEPQPILRGVTLVGNDG